MSNEGFEIKAPLTPLFPRGLSLECCEGDQGAELIEFTFDGRMWMSIIDSLNFPGCINVSAPIPLYHSHVLWSYAHCEVRQPDGSFELSLRDVGPHLGCNVHAIEEMFSVRNHPKGMIKPELLAATGTFVVNGQEKETIEYARNRSGFWCATKRFTRDELAARAGSDGETVCILLSFIVARSYFTLSKLLKEPPTASEETAGMVERILRGEKTPGADWTITVGSHGGDSGLPLTYHVHSAAFSRVSEKFKKACETGRSVDDLIVVKKNEKHHFTIPSLAPDDMPVLISIAYGMAVPLPTNIDRIGMLGRALTHLLNFDVTMAMFPQWEWAICQQALALDKRQLSSFSALPRLLLTVWTAPYGFLPVAKRVVIGVFADMIWLQTPPGGNYMDFMLKALMAMGDERVLSDTMATVLKSMLMHIEIVSAVRKIGLSIEKKKEEGEVVKQSAPPPAKPDLDAPKVVPIDDGVVAPTEKKEEEGAVVSHPAPPAKPDLDTPTVVPIDDDDFEGSEEESTKWQCTIS